MGNPLVTMLQEQHNRKQPGQCNPSQQVNPLSLMQNLLTGKANPKDVALNMFKALPPERKQQIIGQMQMMASVGKQYGATDDVINNFQNELRAIT